MVMILNTEDYPSAVRAKVWTETFHDAVVPMAVTFEEPDQLRGNLEQWKLGDIDILRSHTNTGQALQLTARHARRSDGAAFSIGLQRVSTGRFEQFGTQSEVLPGQVHCVDISEPFEFDWLGSGSSVALVGLTADQLGLPVDTIRRGSTQMASSGLFALVSRHVAQVLSPDLEDDPGAFELGIATVELCRALLVSAARDVRHERAVMAETLMTRIRAYVRQNLHDSELSAHRIAAAHHISLRYLYKLCSAAGFSLEQWIITQRLNGAKHELSAVHRPVRSIAMLARNWGFRDPAYFSRRFRQEFGYSPREWRARATILPSSDHPVHVNPSAPQPEPPALRPAFGS